MLSRIRHDVSRTDDASAAYVTSQRGRRRCELVEETPP